jgi:putative membrane protein
MQMALLGALLTFAPDTLYAIHAIAPMDWGFTPLADQQLGGLIMWIPAAIPYLVIGALIARRGWLTVADQRA